MAEELLEVGEVGDDFIGKAHEKPTWCIVGMGFDRFAREVSHQSVGKVDADTGGETHPSREAWVNLNQLNLAPRVDALEFKGAAPACCADKLITNSE